MNEQTASTGIVFNKTIELLNRDIMSGKLERRTTYTNNDIASFVFLLDYAKNSPDVVSVNIPQDLFFVLSTESGLNDLSRILKDAIEHNSILIPNGSVCCICNSQLFITNVIDQYSNYKSKLDRYCTNIDCYDGSTINRLFHQLGILLNIYDEKIFSEYIQSFTSYAGRYPAGVFDLLNYMFSLEGAKLVQYKEFFDSIREMITNIDIVKFFEICGLPNIINNEDIAMTGIPIDYILTNVNILIRTDCFNEEHIRSLLFNMVTNVFLLDYMTKTILANKRSIMILNGLKYN